MIVSLDPGSNGTLIHSPRRVVDAIRAVAAPPLGGSPTVPVLPVPATVADAVAKLPMVKHAKPLAF